MKKYIIMVMLLLCTFLCRGEGRVQLDSAVRVALTEKLTEYFEAISREPAQVQMGECDFLIESSDDSLIRTHIAQTIYGHYIDSPVMGAEAVAIHVYDKWFKPGLVKMASDMDLLGAQIFAEFNRQSLLGCRAPELTMTTPSGNTVRLFDMEDRTDEVGKSSAQPGCFRVLYFYDTDCSKCRMQTILLRNILESENFPVEFYAIYTGDNRSQWDEYVSAQWNTDPVSAKVIHLWDPQIDSDFQRKYGILQTPRMFLVAPDDTIVGRGLDAVALAQMLHGIFDEVQLEYGSKESAELFDGIFAGSEPSNDDVKAIADHIAATTLQKGDTVMFRQMTGDLLYYLSTRSGEGFKEGLADLVKERILSQPKIWRTADDSLKVVGFAGIMNDLLSKSVPGSRITNLKVPGTLITPKGEKQTSRRLSRLGGKRNIIIFYTEGCHICDAQKAAAHRLISVEENSLYADFAGTPFQYSSRRLAGKTCIFLVNVGDLLRTDPSLANRLFDTFDLSSLPFLLETDRRGIILRRYFLL